jgi:LuxR family quorum sensing-dependent transcriptional regulator
MSTYPQRMFDACSEFEAIDSPQGVADRLAKILSSFGYSAFLITSVPEPPLRLEPYILFNGWPQGWSNHYSQSDYYKSDPVAAWCRKSINPFEWREVPYDKNRNPKAAEVMNVARDFGMKEGFLVPIVRSSIFHDCVTMAGEMACTRFRRHRVWCFDGTGGASWRGGSLHASSSLRRCG